MTESDIRSATIVGTGVVSPAGSILDDMWRVTNAATATRANVMHYPELPELSFLGCVADGFSPETTLERHELRRLDRTHQMSFWAADQALEGLPDGPEPDRCAVVVGTGFGSETFQTAQQAVFQDRGYRALSPLTIPVVMTNSVAAHLSMRYGYRGPSLTVTTACASGANALGEALWLLRSNRADRVLVGGVDALHSARIAGLFARMEAMSTRIDDPETASRPFDAERDGFVLGEGAAYFVLERSSDSPTGLGRLIGYGSNSDAHHIVAPSPKGEGAAACIRAALTDAGISPDDVGHVNAHGTSTALNDQAEAEAIAEVFGPRSLPVTSSKGVIGHLIGAAGAVEALITLCALREGQVPPTANQITPDESVAALIDVSSTPTAPRSALAISNSFGFGGHNTTLVLSR